MQPLKPGKDNTYTISQSPKSKAIYYYFLFLFYFLNGSIKQTESKWLTLRVRAMVHRTYVHCGKN